MTDFFESHLSDVQRSHAGHDNVGDDGITAGIRPTVLNIRPIEREKTRPYDWEYLREDPWLCAGLAAPALKEFNPSDQAD